MRLIKTCCKSESKRFVLCTPRNPMSSYYLLGNAGEKEGASRLSISVTSLPPLVSTLGLSASYLGQRHDGDASYDRDLKERYSHDRDLDIHRE